MSAADLRDLRRRLARLRAKLPTPAVAAALQASVLRFAVVIERWASERPGFSPIPARIMPKADRAALAAWDGNGKLSIALDPAFAPQWLERLARHLCLPGWRHHLRDRAYAKSLDDRVAGAASGLGWKAWPPLPEKSDRALVLSDVAKALAEVEACGGAAPSWMPSGLADAARALNAGRAAVLSMNSEQRAKRRAELLAKVQTQSQSKTPTDTTQGSTNR
jgi:hypothetical protein